MLDPPSTPSSSVQRPRPQAHSDGADSNSDWDEDDDFVAKKINIKIKPIVQATPGKVSANSDELRAAVGTWKSMANINLVKPNSRRSANNQGSLSSVNSAISVTGDKNSYNNSNSNNNQARIEPPPRISDAATQNYTIMPPTRPQSALTFPPPARPQQAPLFSPISTMAIEPLAAQFNAANLMPLIPPPAAQAKQLASLPVAFATQECLNVRALMSSEGEISTSLLGHIKMALPRSIIEMNPAHFENNDLIVRLSAAKSWSSWRTQSEFVRKFENHTDDEHRDNCAHIHPLKVAEEEHFSKLMSLNMKAAYEYARERFQKQPDSQYFLLPELISYTIRSQENARDGLAAAAGESGQQIDKESQLAGAPAAAKRHQQQISPIQAVVHWLCALSVTKVRVDMEFLDDFRLELDAGIRPQDVKNIKLSMEINGNVTSQQSKPEASWCPVESRLSWSFGSFQELIEMSPVNGAISCLAKLTLADGPSTPTTTSLHFSIGDKTISGLQMALVHNSAGRLSYKLARQKKEARTGSFKCEPPHL